MASRDLVRVAVVAAVAAGLGAGLTMWRREAREEHEAKEGVEAPALTGGGKVEAQEAAANRALAKVSEDSARVVALAQVPGGQVATVELENEDERLIYSFDITVAGREGIEEIHIDALTGAMLKREHEASAPEAAEKASKK